MQGIVSGKVLEVERRQYSGRDGVVQVFDAYLAPSNPRYGADRISGPAELVPEVGDLVAYRANIQARVSANGPWLSVFVVEALPEVAETLGVLALAKETAPAW